MSNLGGLEAEIIKTGGSINSHVISNNTNGPIPNKSEPVEHANSSPVLQSGRNYNGFKPDLGDIRDYSFSKLGLSSSKLPTSVDLRSLQAPVDDQQSLGDCVGNACAGMLEFLEIKDKKPLNRLSRLFIYYNARVLENTVKYDSGCAIRDAIKTLVNQGVCPETDDPYVISNFAVKPSTKAYSDALQHKAQNYYRIETLTDMKTCLSSMSTFIFGISVYSSFESASALKTGIVPLPKSSEKLLGGHCLEAVGYSDSNQWIIFKNSWSTSYGASGYGFIPYSYMTNPNLMSDAWCISKDSGL